MDLTVPDKLMLEKLRDKIIAGEIHEGIPRTKIEKLDDGTYLAKLEGFQTQRGNSLVDALDNLHNYLLKYHQKLQNQPRGTHGNDQLRVLDSFLSLQTCDCGHSPDTYCHCRGFETS